MAGLCATFLFCPGCASPPPPPASVTRDYPVMPIGFDIFRITYSGDAAVTSERQLDLALLRACQLGQDRQRFHFAVIDEDASTPGAMIYYPGLNHFVFKPDRGLLVKYFEERPRGLFSYHSRHLARVLADKLNLDR